MTKRLEVYFKNENDAESASLKLKTLRVSNNFIDEMPSGNEERYYVPFATVNSSSSGTPGMVNPAYVAETSSKRNQLEETENPYNEKVTHMLQVDVVDEDYDEAVNILNEFDCFTRAES